MKEKVFTSSLGFVALLFTVLFCLLVIPPFIEDPDVRGAFVGGFVNPYASGYATDVLCCWVILLFWIVYEYPKVKYGWTCLLLGFVPGVAVGFAVYLILRTYQLKSDHSQIQ